MAVRKLYHSFAGTGPAGAGNFFSGFPTPHLLTRRYGRVFLTGTSIDCREASVKLHPVSDRLNRAFGELNKNFGCARRARRI
ncbi:MAG: hypothetical protein LBH72_06685 [Proteiniphilum sp.]|nr:hypothetical protein [Proteiniphilum sp.]